MSPKPGGAPPALALIADDLTGALDASAPFAARGLRVSVALGPDHVAAALARAPDIVAVTTASREIDPVSATAAVRRAAQALPPMRIFKKVDSRLKGHIAAELDALSFDSALAAPAIPEFGRVVRGGHVEGFGVDAPIDVRAVLGHHAARAQVPDTVTQGQMAQAVAASDADLLIGARGLADALAAGMTGNAAAATARLPGPCGLFVIGSRDPITLAQARALRDRPGTVFVGAPNGHAPALPRASCLLVQALPGERPASGTEVADNLAAAVLPLLRPGMGTALLCGGATAEAVLARRGIHCLDVLGECLPGLVVSSADGLTILTKSGGFGGQDSLLRVADMIDKGRP